MTPAVELEGYAEVRAAYMVGVEGTPWTLTERARPRFGIPVGDRVTVEAVVEAGFTQGRDNTDEAAQIILDSEIGDLLDAAGCTYSPEPRYDEVSDYLSVERLHVDLNTAQGDLTVGRQALNWGSGLVFHPTDLYAEVVATEPWKERKGVNAIKAVVPAGDHQVTAVVAVGDDLSPLYDEDRADELEVSAAVKATFRVAGTDLSPVGHIRSDGRWFAGADLRGNLGVGWWIEGGWHGDTEAPKQGGAEVVAGVDYSFDVLQLLYVAAEYRYDGTGEEPEDYDYSKRAGTATMPFDCAFLPQVEPGTRTTLGIHYADASVRLGVTEDLSVAGVAIVNLLDGTGYAVPSAALNVGSHAVVNLGAQIPFGEGGEFAPAKEDLTVSAGAYSADLSGLLPDATLLGWLRYSF